ncbi:DUF4097 family beta strand repeat-containing protein [Balneolaceae bacterium ANBcel3]|nr:DUF4097 family beta strand repeat-containing protein [Balneolaceae bacterium ANBcel3]
MNKRNRPIVLLMAALFAIIFIGSKSSFMIAGSKPNPDLKPENVWKSEQISVQTPGYITATTFGGSISVMSHDKDEILIDIYVRENNKYIRSGEEASVRISLETTEHGAVIKAEPVRSRGLLRRSPSVSVSYRMLVPEKTEVRANTSGGHIHVKDIDHNVTLVTSGGSVSAANINGDVLARTSGGPIKIRKVIGDVTARTSGGGIDITDVAGSLNARTSGGPIQVKNSSGVIDARTSGGPLTFDQVAGAIEGHTSGGPIRATISSLKDHLILKTSGGGIFVKLPANEEMTVNASGSSVQYDLPGFEGKSTRTSISGTVHGGGVPVELSTSGGSVRIETY